MRRLALAMILLLPSSPTSGAEEPAPPSPSAASGTRRALVVCGLPGDAEHRTLFAGVVEKIAGALVERCGFRASDVWVRFGADPEDGDGPAVKGSRGMPTREAIAADAESLRRACTQDDGLWVIVLGHGHFDGRRSHLNLPGPDLDAAGFGKMFAGIAAKEQVFVVSTPASGFFLRPLASPGRVAIAATEADQEVNETLFASALADVLAEPPPEADRDGDGALSVFELYLAVVADVFRRYVEDELIPTEHAQLDDNGDGRGSELQMNFPPPAEPAPDAKEDGQAASKPRPEPKLGLRSDGFRASQIRVDPPKGGTR